MSVVSREQLSAALGNVEAKQQEIQRVREESTEQVCSSRLSRLFCIMGTLVLSLVFSLDIPGADPQAGTKPIVSQ